jgi:hypothetical protein
MLRSIVAAIADPIASKEFESPADTLETSTAIAGAATDRSSRTANRVDVAGDPGNLCASADCSTSASRWLLST